MTGTSVIMNTSGSVGMLKKCSNLKTHICYFTNITELIFFHKNKHGRNIIKKYRIHRKITTIILYIRMNDIVKIIYRHFVI